MKFKNSKQRKAVMAKMKRQGKTYVPFTTITTVPKTGSTWKVSKRNVAVKNKNGAIVGTFTQV